MPLESDLCPCRRIDADTTVLQHFASSSSSRAQHRSLSRALEVDCQGAGGKKIRGMSCIDRTNIINLLFLPNSVGVVL